MRAHRSHSQLNSWLKCGYAYYLQRVLKKPESPCVWLPAGKAFHTATEQYDRFTAEENEGAPTIGGRWEDAFTDAFEQELDILRATHPDESTWRVAGKRTKDKPDKENILWWHTFGRDLVAKYIDWRVSVVDTWEIATVNGAPGIEIEMLTPVSGSVPVKSYVDRLLRSKLDSRLVVVDLKSGSRTPASPGQLMTYAHQLEKVTGEEVRWGAWYDARKGSLSEPIDLFWSAGMTGELYEQLDHAVEAGIFLPNVDSHCNNCGVAKFCKYNGGSENA